jgi:four helix bundle protein
VIIEKSYAFSVSIVKLYLKLHDAHKWEHALFEQLLRCGTSIGANAQEAAHAQSHKDFVCKMSIALKEASETQYWLRLLADTGFLSGDDMLKDCNELIRILTAILKSAKEE